MCFIRGLLQMEDDSFDQTAKETFQLLFLVFESLLHELKQCDVSTFAKSHRDFLVKYSSKDLSSFKTL